MRALRSGLAAAVALAALAAWAPSASATFHLMQIREVYPGSSSNPGAEYVELQMWAAGQNHVAGHVLHTYGPGGAPSGNDTFPADVAREANQSTMVLATPEAEAQFGIVADAPLAPNSLDPAAGAVCWEAIDCVSWGVFAGSLPSPAGSPAAPSGIPDGMALRRSIAAGCPTFLEPGDDHDNSAADFELVFPGPRPNSAPPSEHECTASPGGGQSGGGGGGAAGNGPGAAGGAPQTLLRHKPAKRSHDSTPTFSFAADEPGASFECKLDARPYRRCRSPFTTPKLSPGQHTIRVRARDSSGHLDPSPVAFAFKILAPPRQPAV